MLVPATQSVRIWVQCGRRSRTSWNGLGPPAIRLSMTHVLTSPADTEELTGSSNLFGVEGEMPGRAELIGTLRPVDEVDADVDM